MKRMRFDLIEAALSEQLISGEMLEAVGIFKKVPTVRWMLFTRGFAWIIAQEFHLGITNRRMIILPVSDSCCNHKAYESALFANFNDVFLHKGPLNSTMLDIHVEYRGKPLNLRYKERCNFDDSRLYEFTAALKQKTQS